MLRMYYLLFWRFLYLPTFLKVLCWPDYKTWRALIFSEFVCLSVCVCVCVCLWPALLPCNVNRFWQNLVITRTLLWSSLAATIMVQIGCRGTARRLFENIKEFSKITEFEFQNSGPSFFASVSPVYCKKLDLIGTKLTEEIDFEVCPYGNSSVCHFGNLPPIVACRGSTGRVAGGVLRQSTTDVRMCGSTCCVRIIPRIWTGGIWKWGAIGP